jgi:hypothetical protein
LKVLSFFKIASPAQFQPKEFVLAMKELLVEAEKIAVTEKFLTEYIKNLSQATIQFVRTVKPKLQMLDQKEFLAEGQPVRVAFGTLLMKIKEVK